MQPQMPGTFVLNVFNANSPPAFTIAVFDIKSCGTEDYDGVIDTIKERLPPGMKLINHTRSVFTVNGTAISIFNVLGYVMVDNTVESDVFYGVAKSIGEDRPIIGATYIRSWSVELSTGDVWRDLPSLSDTEVRTLGIQHPDIETRAWFGRDEDGKPILRTAIVGSTDEIEGRSPPDSGDEDEPTGSSSVAAP
jgi:hypothetical protein